LTARSPAVAGDCSEDHVSHLLPQRREKEDEGEGEDGEGVERGGVDSGGCSGGGFGCCGRWRVGVLVTADAGHGLVALVLLGTAEVAVAHVPAALVVAAGEGGQLLEVLVLAAPLTVTAGSSRAIILTVRFPVLRAVDDRLHAESLVDVSPVRVSVAGEVRVTVGVRLAGTFSVLLVYLGVVLPRVTDVLEAGPVRALLHAVTVVDAGLEGRLDLLQLVETL